MSETTTGLSEAATKDMINELMSRHEEIIIVRELLKNSGSIGVHTKTRPGKSGRQEVGFDLAMAIDLIQSAQTIIIGDYITGEEDDTENWDFQGNSDDPPEPE